MNFCALFLPTIGRHTAQRVLLTGQIAEHKCAMRYKIKLTN